MREAVPPALSAQVEGEDAFELPIRPEPASNTGFVEATMYCIPCPEQDYSFRIDDEDLALETRDGRACWVWAPGFYAGEVTGELYSPEGRVGLYLIDVSPNPGKLGRSLFSVMVEELWNEDPALVVGDEPAKTPVGKLGPNDDPWLSFWRLRRYGNQAVSALQPICARPRHGLMASRQRVRPHRVRSVDRQTALAAVRDPGALAATVGQTEWHGPEIRFDCPRTEETLDTAANRTLLVMVRAMLHRSRSVRRALEHQVTREKPGETRTLLADRWRRRREFLTTLELLLEAALRRSPFSAVRRAEVTAAGLNAVAADPVYARAYRMAWLALRHGLEGPPTDERLWMSPSWEIYERWCFVALGRLLEANLLGLTWKARGSASRILVGSTVDGDARLELSLQPQFPSESPSRSTGRWSVSRQRYPDIVLTMNRGNDSRFWVFDAKYRSKRESVLDAMTSAHVYQDSLRVGQRRPEATWLLVPRGGATPWLEEPDFVNRHRVGVHTLTPGEGMVLPPSLIGEMKQLMLT